MTVAFAVRSFDNQNWLVFGAASGAGMGAAASDPKVELLLEKNLLLSGQSCLNMPQFQRPKVFVLLSEPWLRLRCQGLKRSRSADSDKAIPKARKTK